MKRTLQPATVSTTAAVGVLLLIAACATTGRERATRTTDSMDAVESDYRQTSAQIDKTKASLQALMRAEQADLKKAYGVYAADVKRTEALAKQLYGHTEKMTTFRDEYFLGWERSYTNADIRELSEQRSIKLREVYAQIPAASVGVRGALEAYVTDISEIDRYLANDLTPRAVQGIEPISRKAVKDGERVQEEIAGVLTAIGQVKAEMGQGGKKQ